MGSVSEWLTHSDPSANPRGHRGDAACSCVVQEKWSKYGFDRSWVSRGEDAVSGKCSAEAGESCRECCGRAGHNPSRSVGHSQVSAQKMGESWRKAEGFVYVCF